MIVKVKEIIFKGLMGELRSLKLRFDLCSLLHDDT